MAMSKPGRPPKPSDPSKGRGTMPPSRGKPPGGNAGMPGRKSPLGSSLGGAARPMPGRPIKKPKPIY